MIDLAPEELVPLLIQLHEQLFPQGLHDLLGGGVWHLILRKRLSDLQTREVLPFDFRAMPLHKEVDAIRLGNLHV